MYAASPGTAVLSLVPAPNGRSRYAVLADTLRERIVAGDWPPGTALPAEQALAIEFGVALGTLRQARALLASQSLIERIHGRGNFVRAGLGGAPMLRFFRFSEGTGEVPHSRICSRQVLLAPAEAARRLAVPRGSPVLRLHRVRSLGNQPCLFEEIWLPMPLFERLATGDPAHWGNLLYPLFAEQCGVHVQRAVDDITFGALSVAHARHLALAPGSPCAVVTRSAFDLAGRCVEWRTTRGDANAFHYTVNIT